jgi:putative inorganic carbon (hco3(-)) transporter
MGAITNLGQNGRGNLIGATPADSISAQHPTSQRKVLVGAYVALVLFMVIYCGRPEDWIPGLSDVPLAKIAGIVSLLALVFSLGQIRNRFPREVTYLVLLIGQLFLASLLSPVWRGGAFLKTVDFAKVLLVVVVITVAVNTTRRLRLLVFVQAASVALIAVVTVVKGRALGERLDGMLGGNYSNPNDLALAIVISLPLCLGLLFLTRNRLWKAAWAITMLVMVYGVILTGSRGGFIALTITAIVCLWHFAIRGHRRYFLVLVPLVGAILWLSSGDTLSNRLNETLDSKDPNSVAYASSQERQQLFWRSVDITEEHPLLGVGPGNFEVISGSWRETHNTFTQLSSEGGLPALILYVLILWHGFRNLRTTKRLVSRRSESSLLAGVLQASLVGYVVGSVFASVGLQFFPYLLVAYTTALALIAKNIASHSKEPKSVSQSALENEAYAHSTELDMSWHLG